MKCVLVESLRQELYLNKAPDWLDKFDQQITEYKQVAPSINSNAEGTEHMTASVHGEHHEESIDRAKGQGQAAGLGSEDKVGLYALGI